ncbi:helix-turn-helix transcriptional regulator [Microbacterium sp. P06]|uniref:helix-turn-helix transcriptional regulator n=1 Tax=Microbacterium sp. P06 TaxID=3366949 RepID=UPI003746EAD4
MRNLVAETRKSLEWSQQRLADEVGVSRQTVISIERGRFDPSLPLAFRLASVFDRRIEDLFFPDAESSAQLD